MVTKFPSRLRHLLPLDLQEAVVHPVPFAMQRRAVRAARLRDLVLVVREDEVDAAAVDVERLAEQRAATWPSTRCASRAGPCPTATASGSPGFDGFHSTKSIGSRL